MKEKEVMQLTSRSSPKNSKKQLLQGNVVSAHAAMNAGATHFFGYPITPSSEILETWVNLVGDINKPAKSPITKEPLNYLQCEDEMASGFAMIGACMAGQKAFTATAGPGNVLMQDAFSAAEALRVPTVALIVQRGGLSTSTVIYSQEEVTLTCFGGNGEGFRIVYSPSNIQEMYNLTLRAFNSAWKYRFPTFVLSDGYQGKMQGEVEMKPMAQKDYVEPEPILLGKKRKKGEPTNLRNCYDQEEEIFEIIESYRKDYEKLSPKIAESEYYQTKGAQTVIVAHGIVATAAKVAVDELRKKNHSIGLWRPITLRPLDLDSLIKSLEKANRIVFIESALGQLAKIVLDELGHRNLKNKFKIETYYRPAIGITPEEIVKFLD